MSKEIKLIVTFIMNDDINDTDKENMAFHVADAVKKSLSVQKMNPYGIEIELIGKPYLATKFE